MAKRHRSKEGRRHGGSEKMKSKKKRSVAGKENYRKQDKFSNLSDLFFYRILSLLPLDDIARLSTLSKRFRQRCFMNQCLEIDLNKHNKDDHETLQQAQQYHEKSRQKIQNSYSDRHDSSDDYDSDYDYDYDYDSDYGYDYDYDYDYDYGKSRRGSTKKQRINNMHKEEEMSYFLINVLDKVMKLRKNKDMKSLKISPYRFKADEADHVNGWIQNAVKCNVQKLDIELTIENGQCLQFPCSKSLKSFELNLHNGGSAKFTSEGGAYAYSSLRLLTLESVRIVKNEEDFGKLVSSCKCLETLSLKNLFGVEKIEIESSSLRVISILKTKTSSDDDDLKHIQVSAYRLKKIHIAWYFKTSEEKSLYLFAPRLRSFKWKGDALTCSNFGNFVYLTDASINLRHPSMLTENHQSSTEEVSVQDSLVQLIKSVRRVTYLELNCWHIEVLIEHNHKQTSLDDAEELVLNVSSIKKDRQVIAIIAFLKLLPKLRTLKIKCCRQPWGPGADMGNAMVLSTSSGDWISRLKSVEIELTGGGDETELIKHLLKHAKELEKMTILYSSLDMYRLTELTKSLDGFKTSARSRASLFFIPFL